MLLGGGLTASAQTSTQWAVDLPEVSAFLSYAGGPSAPGATSFGISNASSLTISWAAVRSVSWISCYPDFGLLPPSSSTNLLLFPNGESLKLAAGIHLAEICFTNSTFTESVTRGMELSVRIPAPGSVEFLDQQVSNRLHLLIGGTPGTSYLVESSDNLTAWDFFAANIFEFDQAVLTLKIVPGMARFYRASAKGIGAVPPGLALAPYRTNDQRLIEIHGDIGGIYRTEFSTNVLQWAVLSTNQIPAEGSLILTNQIDEGSSELVYRLTGLDVFPLETVHQATITGQSLGIGAGGTPSLSNDPSEVHFRVGSDDLNTYITPLVELGAETIASGLAEHVSLLAPEHRLAIGNNAMGGAAYAALKKGTAPYARAIQQFRQAPAAFSRLLLRVTPAAVFVVHGEADHVDSSYGLNLRAWQADYESDIRNITGQNVPVPMFHSQASAWTSVPNGSATTTVGAYKLLAESEANPDKTILVCPKYFFTYTDGIHMTNSSYRWLGEYYAKAYRKVVVEGGTWMPLKPVAATRTDEVITARFHVPFPPLVLDTNLVSDPGRFGFEYFDQSGDPPTIVSLDLIQPDTVVLTLSAIPTGTGERLRYAYTGIPGNSGGPLTGPRGNLRDSDPEISLYGNTLFNWCVHFDQPILNKPVE